jgi:hypothetical protein
MPPPADQARLVAMFQQFAEFEFAGRSPIYAVLARACAEDLELAEPLHSAPPRQRRALLLFAAAQYVLRTEDPGHPLAGYLPVLGGRQPVDDGLVPALRDLVGTHRTTLHHLCATRTTQTNEAARAALLRPALGRATQLLPGSRHALIELGCSAGLLLLPDRYGYRYRTGDREDRYGQPADPALDLACAVDLEPGAGDLTPGAGDLGDLTPRSGDLGDLTPGSGEPSWQWPDPVATVAPIADRVGIDLQPVDATDPDGVAWLRSCIWPEHVDRLLRLDAALEQARQVRPRLVRGDLVDQLPAVLDDVPTGAVAAVFSSQVVTYLSRAAQAGLVDRLDRYGAEHDLALVLNEAPSCGVDLLTRQRSRSGDGPAEAIGVLVLVVWRDGRATVEALGRTGPHGTSLVWQPHRYAYQPTRLAGSGA